MIAAPEASAIASGASDCSESSLSRASTFDKGLADLDQLDAEEYSILHQSNVSLSSQPESEGRPASDADLQLVMRHLRTELPAAAVDRIERVIHLVSTLRPQTR